MEQLQGQSGTKPYYKSKYKTLIIQVIFCFFFASALCICFNILLLQSDFTAWHVGEQRRPLLRARV